MLGETNSQRSRKKLPSDQAWNSSSQGSRYTNEFGSAIVMKDMIEYIGMSEQIFKILFPTIPGQ